MPYITLKIPTRHYGANDLKLARGLTNFMELCGRAQYAKNVMLVLENLVSHRPLDAGAGLQSYISCAFQKGSLFVTSSLAPQAYGRDKQSK